MQLSKKPYKGTRDFFPKDKRIQNYIFQVMRKTAESFAYEPYDGPMLEEVELYKAKSGEELINEQIYSFTDRGKRFVAIRPEMTPTVARMVAQVHREEVKPLRWYSIPNLMRYEQPQKGRLREHWQFNCDIFGAPGRMGELEVIQLAVSLMKNFGAQEKQFELCINDRQIVDLIFQKIMGLNQEQTYRFYKLVDRSKKLPEDAFQKQVEEQGLSEETNSIFNAYLKLDGFQALKIFLETHNALDSASEFFDLIELIQASGLDRFVRFDPAIVRGLDYYTGVVFEMFDLSPENRRAICGGGSYANLLKIFNETPLPGVGLGLGDVTLTDFLMTHKLLPEDLERPSNDILISFQVPEAQLPAIRLAQDLREGGHLNVLFNQEVIKVKKLFPLAEKKGARFVAILDEQEIANNKVTIKNMKTREQHDFALDQLTNIKELLKY